MEWIKNHWFLLTMLAIATILSFVWLFVFNRKKLNAKWWECLIISIACLIYGVISVVVFAFIENGFNLNKLGSISLFGSIFLAPLIIIVITKIKGITLKDGFDIFVVVVVLANIAGRLNCLHAGCCTGIIMGSSGFRWPTREFDLLIHILFIVFAIPWILKGKSNGKSYPLYMAFYGIGRFLNEWFRESESSSFLHFGHIWSICALMIGAIWLIILLKIDNKNTKGVMKYESN